MKKIFTLLFSFFVLTTINAQTLLVEDFNYSGELTSNGWIPHSGTGTLPIQTTTGLTYTGYAGSGVGNAANVVNNGEDIHKTFANQTADGTNIYTSFLVNVTEAANSVAGGYFLHLGNEDDANPNVFTAFAPRVFVRVDASGNVNFGLSNTSTGTYGTTNFAKNTTYLIIVKYTINTSGNDNTSMWVISSGVPVTEAAAGTPELSITTQTGVDVIDAIGLRQASGIPDVIVDGIRIANDWTNAPLPVTLLSFDATPNDNKTNLTWSTANEVNAASFDVERSINGKDFKSIGVVEANNGTTTNNYSFVDNSPVAGVSYYRLKMNDRDRSFKYSAVEMVKTKTIGVSVYPNPVRSSITVQHEVAAKGAVISVMDMSGKQATSIIVQAGAVQTTINAAQLAPGSYLIVYTNNGVRQTKQFIKE